MDDRAQVPRALLHPGAQRPQHFVLIHAREQGGDDCLRGLLVHLLVWMGDALLQGGDDAAQHLHPDLIRDRGSLAPQAHQEHLEEPQPVGVRMRRRLPVPRADGLQGERSASVLDGADEEAGQAQHRRALRGLRSLGPEAAGDAREGVAQEELPAADVFLLGRAQLLRGDRPQGGPQCPELLLRPPARCPERTRQDLDEEDVVLDLALGLPLQAPQQAAQVLDEARVASARAEGYIGLEKGGVPRPGVA
mmetsp:Transcript_21328/g.59158  ORF Transcript_21328/g.59158 Transcript_21328/m.59158 type:complete len:249 (-) Transcript_21328:256-1002(-)